NQELRNSVPNFLDRKLTTSPRLEGSYLTKSGNTFVMDLLSCILIDRNNETTCRWYFIKLYIIKYQYMKLIIKSEEQFISKIIDMCTIVQKISSSRLRSSKITDNPDLVWIVIEELIHIKRCRAIKKTKLIIVELVRVIIVASGTNKTSEIRYMKNTNAFYDKYTVCDLMMFKHDYFHPVPMLLLQSSKNKSKTQNQLTNVNTSILKISSLSPTQYNVKNRLKVEISNNGTYHLDYHLLEVDHHFLDGFSIWTSNICCFVTFFALNNVKFYSFSITDTAYNFLWHQLSYRLIKP
ncbi:hypothetical protein AGLY_010883, partial [Aphis glycines]